MLHDVSFETVNEKDKMATISCSKNNKIIDEINYTEELLLTKIDSIEVGNFENGWPQFVYAQDGKRTIEVRLEQPWKIKKTRTIAVLPGSEGEKKDALMNEKSNSHVHYQLSFNVIKGKKYIISVKSDETALDRNIFTITDIIDNKEVPFDLIRIVTPPQPIIKSKWLPE